jgi:lantibiotic biosynthesis dehydratase-like protein
MNPEQIITARPQSAPGSAAVLQAAEAVAPTPAKKSPQAHLFGLPQPEWGVWRWVCLRGAGFPGHLIHKLAAPCAAVAADRLLESEKDFGEYREQALAEIRREMDLAGESSRRKELARLITSINKGKSVAPTGSVLDEVLQRMTNAAAVKNKAGVAFTHAFESGVKNVSARMREVAADPAFRRAVLLQNREALHSGVDSLLEHAKRGKKERQHEELIASYLQRYCMKNDSIGFFGPVGWARVVDRGPAILASPGPGLVSVSTIYFEHWGIQALAQKLAENKAVRPWLAPRRMPTFYLDGTILHVPGGTASLFPLQIAILRRCTGERTARQIAQELIGIPGTGVRSESEVYEMLDQLTSRGIIGWGLDLPIDVYPERRLRKALERIGEAELRASALNTLGELEQARDSVAGSEEDPARLDLALQDLESTFTRLTGQQTTRSAGKMYAARTLVYQDCRRDIDLQIGPDLIRNLAAPLSLILTSARWFTSKAAQRYRQVFQQVHADLASRSRNQTVDLVRFWMQAQPLLMDNEKRLFNQIVPEYQQHWEEIFELDATQSRVQYCSDELQERVQAKFAAPRAGWQMARYHSPDVMIAASSVEAIQRGDYSLVLGEVHMAINTVRGFFAMAQHPHPEEMVQAIEADLQDPRVNPVPPLSWPGLTTRTSFALLSPRDYHLEISHDSISRGLRSQTLPIAAFVVENSDKGLIVRTRDNRLRFDILEFFGDVLSAEAVDYLRVVRSRPHVPRLCIDRLVVARETWSFPAEELSFAVAENETERFIGARRWARNNGLPRYLFCRVQVEVKPFFVDLDSPVFVELLCKMVRRVLASDLPNRSVTISEMLPGPDQLWLPDACGNRYTSEFRMVAVDRIQ